MLTRRELIKSAAAALPLAAAEAQPKRVAIITTIYRLQSHGQHIGDRLIIGYPYGGARHKPTTTRWPRTTFVARKYVVCASSISVTPAPRVMATRRLSFTEPVRRSRPCSTTNP